MRNRP